MSSQIPEHALVQNRILGALPSAEYQRLLPNLVSVDLALEEIVIESGERVRDLYFPINSVISLISSTKDGATAEIATVGNEGLVGVEAFLGDGLMHNQSIVQTAGKALKLKVDALKEEFARCGQLQRLLLGYTHLLLIQVSQSVVCNRHHTVKKRLVRWLLQMQDLIKTDDLPLTQELISRMLGTTRPKVSVAMKSLRQEGLLGHQRGKISIINRRGMEAFACECFIVCMEAYVRIVNTHDI